MNWGRGVGEVFAQEEAASSGETAVQHGAGLRWEAREGFALDAAAGSKISGEGPDFTATVGLTWISEFENSESE